MNMLNNYSITKITEYISGTIKKKKYYDSYFVL